MLWHLKFISRFHRILFPVCRGICSPFIMDVWFTYGEFDGVCLDLFSPRKFVFYYWIWCGIWSPLHDLIRFMCWRFYGMWPDFFRRGVPCICLMHCRSWIHHIVFWLKILAFSWRLGLWWTLSQRLSHVVLLRWMHPPQSWLLPCSHLGSTCVW